MHVRYNASTIVSFRGLLDDLVALGIQRKGVRKCVLEQIWTYHIRDIRSTGSALLCVHRRNLE